MKTDEYLRYGCLYMLGVATALYLIDDCSKVQSACTGRGPRGRSIEGNGMDLDFIEIGTSNFETLIGNASQNSRGLSVEGLKMYQDQLPDKPHVIKVNAAISAPEEGQNTIDFYYIHPDDVKKHHLPPWLIGCNAAGAPQKENRNKEELMRKDTVPVLSFEQLMNKYQVNSIGYLKLDVEGHEPIILKSMIEACEKNPSLWPRALTYEHKHVKGYDQRDITKKLTENGYIVAAFTNGDHRDYTFVRINGVQMD